jgi:hypothetical protein
MLLMLGRMNLFFFLLISFSDCRVIVCRSLESPSPRPPPTPLLDTHQEPAVLHEPQPSTPSSPQKRTSPRQLSDSMSPSPSKRSRATGGGSDSTSTPFQKPAKKHFFMNRDFHLEAVLEKSNSRKPPVEEAKAEDEHEPDTGKGGESGHQEPGEVHHEDKEKHQKKKKKKKHKKHLLTEADFDSPGLVFLFFPPPSSLSRLPHPNQQSSLEPFRIWASVCIA